MAALALYRKYRSRDFAELVGQDHIAQNLMNALDKGRISHAYLFTGPRGVGKTSTARILARRLNQVENTETHLDIIEIDAASNRRIDEIRDLREKVHLAPSVGAYKVYIIDEVHMLTTEAFNALLKTLEEPPAHVIFILATTEPHKLPDTIISRTQSFAFRPVAADQIARHLRFIAEQEKIDISDEGLQLLSTSGQGSFRDSISLLDQVANVTEEHINADMVADLLGLPPATLIRNLLSAAASGDTKTTLSTYDTLLKNGTTPQVVLQELLKTARDWVRTELGLPQGQNPQQPPGSVPPASLNTITLSLSSLSPNLGHLEVALEAALVAISLGQTQTKTPAATPNRARQITQTISQPRPIAASKKPPLKAAENVSVSKTAQDPAAFSQTLWLKALTLVKTRNNSLYAMLRSAVAEPKEDVLYVRFRFQFHRRRLEQSQNLSLLEAALKKCGMVMHVKPQLLEQTTEVKASPSRAAKEDTEAIKQVMQILGGEVIK